MYYCHLKRCTQLCFNRSTHIQPQPNHPVFKALTKNKIKIVSFFNIVQIVSDRIKKKDSICQSIESSSSRSWRMQRTRLRNFLLTTPAVYNQILCVLRRFLGYLCHYLFCRRRIPSTRERERKGFDHGRIINRRTTHEESSSPARVCVW